MFNLPIYHSDLFEFQIMKLLLTFFATMTSGFVFEPMNDMQTDHGLNIGIPSQSSLLVPISRNKRDLIGFNRQGNNNFSHKRRWNNRVGTLL